MRSFLLTVALLMGCGLATRTAAQTEPEGGYAKLHGVVRDAESGETLAGANAIVVGQTIGTSTNSYGAYSLRVPRGECVVRFTYVGYAAQEVSLNLLRDSALDVQLRPDVEIEEVVVVGEQRNEGSRTTRMGTHSISPKMVAELPTLLGEKDALKVVQLMPGVQRGNEGASGIFVRGGGSDQNLIVLDEAPVYNAYHLMGMFSLFNGNALKNMELIKGGFPAKYGGRLASVMDISMEEGNLRSYHGAAGIGFISAHAMVQGPIVKDKLSFVATGRRTYADLLFQLLTRDENAVPILYFYDATLKLRWLINRRHTLYLSGYLGKDKFGFAGGENRRRDDGLKAELGWGNITTTLRWNWFATSSLFGNLSLYYSRYDLGMHFGFGKRSKEDLFTEYTSGINTLGLKWDWTWTIRPGLTGQFGLQSQGYLFNPSSSETKVFHYHVKQDQGIGSLENALYYENELTIGDYGKVAAGLRGTHYWQEGFNQLGVEPRVRGVLYLTGDLSLKGSYAYARQHIHQLSHAGLGLPTDIWVPATTALRPSTSWIVSAGGTYDLRGIGSTLTLEGYYKQTSGQTHYREGEHFGASIGFTDKLPRRFWESSITQGQGWSAGVELMFQRKMGAVTGWLSYTLSWTRVQFDAINRARWFWAQHDRRHNISTVLTWDITRKWRVSATWIFGTGLPITLPSERYQAFKGQPGSRSQQAIAAQEYKRYNSVRMLPSHRLDLGLQYRADYWKKVEAYWSLDIFNVYNQRNAFFYFVGTDVKTLPNGLDVRRTAVKQLRLFPIIPSISFHVKF